MPTGDRARPNPPPSRRPSRDVRKNRRSWDREAGPYEARHRSTLGREGGLAWGLWRIPEAQLRMLGPVRGKRILELGCGAASWSIGLARRGARVTGLDVSPRRLDQARAAMARAGVTFPLVEASAESVPLPAGSFDAVLSDWGAMTFCDPYRTVPEVARLLRPGGVFAFATASTLRSICQDRRTDRLTARLRYDYFSLHRMESPDQVEFQLPVTSWSRLFRSHRLVVEDLVEPRPRAGATSTYLGLREAEWARHWPLEVIWKLRRTRGPPRASRA